MDGLEDEVPEMAAGDVLLAAIARAIELGGPDAAVEFLSRLARVSGRPEGYLYGYGAGDAAPER